MTEDNLQQKIYVWFNNNYCLKHQNPRFMIFSVPNGGTRNILEAKKLKATGLLAGVSDLIIVLPNKILFVELKTSEGRQSDNQKDFEQRVNLLGFQYFVIRDLEQFQKLIENEI